MTIALPSAAELAAALIAREELPPERGEQGPQGKAGLDGETGGFGPAGPQGAKGDEGRVGPVGPEGKRGPKGEKGDKGDQGREGEKGDKGDEGPRGEQGPTGPSGSGRTFFPRGGGGSGGGSQTALTTPFTPAGTISATNVQAAIEEVAAEAGTGGGLPPQWTDGGNGDVTATTDDNTKTAITIVGLPGQLQAAPLLNLKRDTGENAFRVSQDPTPGYSAVLGDDAANQAFQQWGTDAEPGVYNQSTFRLYVSGQKVGFDSYEDLVDPTQSYTEVRLQMQTGQILPVLRLLFDSGDPALQVLATGAIASADSLGLFGVTPPAQQTIDAPNATPEQIANILIAYGLAVQSP